MVASDDGSREARPPADEESRVASAAVHTARIPRDRAPLARDSASTLHSTATYTAVGSLDTADECALTQRPAALTPSSAAAARRAMPLLALALLAFCCLVRVHSQEYPSFDGMFHSPHMADWGAVGE
jgi:hypothetical protein